MFILFHPAITLPEIHAEELIWKVINYMQQDVHHNIIYNSKNHKKQSKLALTN